MRPDSVEARHILISSADAESKIDSLKNLISKGQSFVSLAETYSEDQGSAAKGGDLGWFAEGQMVNEFNEACFSANKGELVTVNTQFGTHLIEIVDKSKSVKKYKIAYLDRQVLYSNSTYQEVFAKAKSKLPCRTLIFRIGSANETNDCPLLIRFLRLSIFDSASARRN